MPRFELYLSEVAREQLKLIGWWQSCGRQIEADVSEEIDLHGQGMTIKDWRSRCLCRSCRRCI